VKYIKFDGEIDYVFRFASSALNFMFLLIFREFSRIFLERNSEKMSVLGRKLQLPLECPVSKTIFHIQYKIVDLSKRNLVIRSKAVRS